MEEQVVNQETLVETPKKQEKILELKNVRQYFRVGSGKNRITVKAVHNVSFSVNKGEVFGLVGESGCGKTTTGRSIIKLYNITDGEIYFKGVRISAGYRTHTDLIKIAKKGPKLFDKKVIEYLKSSSEVELNVTEFGVSDLEKNISNAKVIEEVLSIREMIKPFDEKIVALKETYNNELQELEAKYENAKEYPLEQKLSYEAKKEELKAVIQQAKELKLKELSVILSYAKEWIASAKKDNVRNPEIMNNIQMIFQDPIDSLDPRMTVREIIAEGMIINGERDKELITKKVNDALELVGLLPDHAGRYPHEFSGGQRQRIGIARALVINPELIIADEPISALDVSIQAQVINLLNDLRNKFQLTIVFIAHNLSVVKYFCDRIGVMYYGRLVEVATAEELFAHPLHPYTKSLLSAVPLPDPAYEKNRTRIFYRPSLRPRTEDKPQMVEITPGHFVYGSKSEIERYEKELRGEPVEQDPTLIDLK